VSREFYQWGGGTEQDHAALAWFSGSGRAQMGALRASFRGGIAPIAWAKALALMVVLCGLVGALVGVVGPDGSGLGAVVGAVAATAVLYLLIVVAAWVAARCHGFAVHEHGLVVTTAWGSPEAIPWATIDPGRVFVATTVRAMIRMPLSLSRQRAVFAPGVVINGWTDQPRGSVEWFEQFSSGYRYQPRPVDSPFGWWQLGVTSPQDLLVAIESAMLADGFPAAGLTSFALSRSAGGIELRRDPSLQGERALTDSVIGLPTR
jgi:hypothetical protein